MPKPQPPQEFCSVEGCGLPVHSKKLCNVHIVRLRRHGDVNANYAQPAVTSWPEPKIVLSASGQRICMKEGCERKHEARGFCATHYEHKREKIHGSPRRRKKKKIHEDCAYRKICVIEGCGKNQVARGFCKVCYAQLNKARKKVGASWDDDTIIALLIRERAMKAKFGVALHNAGVFHSAFPNYLIKTTQETKV